MGYADEGDALADLDGRRLLAAEGISVEFEGRPYSETLFSLVEARVEERAIVLDVSPTDDVPEKLVGMVFRRDMLFAACTA
jgi:hypothetical protein